MRSQKHFINLLRTCKTTEEENDLCLERYAEIKKAFKEGSEKDIYKGLLGLIFLYTYGFPFHNGELECIKMAASSNITYKKLGYLATTILLDSKHPATTLLLNSLRSDLKSSNSYVIGMALGSIISLKTDEIFYSLQAEILELCKHYSSYVRSRAFICAIKLAELDSETIEESICESLFEEKRVGQILAEIEYANAVVKISKKAKKIIISKVDIILKIIAERIKNNDKSNTFLIFNSLKLLKNLAKNHPTLAGKISGDLVNFAEKLNTLRPKEFGILYEISTTLIDIGNSYELKNVSTKILSNFLLHAESNTCYLALSMLDKLSNTIPSHVKIHYKVILDCIKSSDQPIQKKAINLSIKLATKETIELVSTMILDSISTMYPEQVHTIITTLPDQIEKLSDNNDWTFRTLTNLLQLQSNYVEEAVYPMIRFLSKSPDDFLIIAMEKFFDMLKENILHPNLSVAAIWIIGEKIEILNDLTIEKIISNFFDFLLPDKCIDIIQKFIINSLCKIGAKKSKNLDLIIKSLETLKCNNNEVRSLAIEASKLLSTPESVRSILFSSIPILKPKSIWLLDTKNESFLKPTINLKGDDNSENHILFCEDFNQRLAKNFNILAKKVGFFTHKTNGPIKIELERFKFATWNFQLFKIRIININDKHPIKDVKIGVAAQKLVLLKCYSPSSSFANPLKYIDQLLYVDKNGLHDPIIIRIRINYNFISYNYVEDKSFNFEEK